MKLNFLEYTLIGLSIVLFFIILAQWIVWKFKRKPFTRERFAFLGLNLIVSLIIYIIPYLFGNNLFFEFLNLISTNLFNHPIEISNPDWSDKVLAFLFILFVGYLYLKVFKSWSWRKSVYQVEAEKQREPISVFKDIRLYMEGGEQLRLYNAENDDKPVFILKEPVVDSIAWHEQVFDLLTLSSNQYKLNLKKDWYQKEHCFISSYGKQSQPLSVLCVLDLPSHKKIIDFVRFSIKQLPEGTKKDDIIFLIAAKNEDVVHEVITVENYKITIVNEEYLLDELIDFSNYNTYILEQFEEKEIISGYEYCLNDVYTQPTCKIKDRKKESFSNVDDIEKYIIDWVNETKNKKHLAILGEYGQGKSVLSLRTAYTIIKNKELSKRIPIIIELRGRYPKQYPNSLALLSDWCANFSINPKALLKLHHAGRLILIFEGFDEMELIGDYEIRVDHFRKLWGFSTPNSKLIITGRPNFFLNDNELKTLLRTSTEYSDLSYCEEIYLRRFSLDQITDALRNTPTSTRNDILHILSEQNESNSFFDLLSRPSSLFLTSIVWKERNLSQFKDNINSALVIEEFLKHSYSRQENKGNKAALSIYERAYFMQGIAVGMAKKSRYTNQISQTELKEIILKLYNDFPEEITKKNIETENYNKPIQKRFDKRYNEETVLLDIRSCGVLVRDLATFDSFKFSHKSFLELLVSDYITNSLIRTDCESDKIVRIINNSIDKALDCSPSQLPKTPDVIKFMAEHSIRLLKIEDRFTPKDTIKLVFNSLYPFKSIGMEKAFRLIPLLGHNIKYGLFIMFQGTTMAGFVSYSIVELISNIITKYNSEFSHLLLVNILIFTFMFIIQCKLFHSMFIKTPAFINLFISIIQNNPNVLSKEVSDSITFTDANLIYDRGNLLLIFLISKELGVLDSLCSLMPKKLYKSLEIQEKYLNRYKNGNTLTEEELMAITRAYK